MKYRFLGSSGLRVSVLSYGNWLTAADPEKIQQSVELIHHAYKLGINFFDTAETYAYGVGETTLG